MTGWNLPPGCTQDDIDRAFGADEDYPPDDDDCCHEDYDTDSEGVRWCNRCSFHWYPTPEEIEAEHHRQQEYDRWCRQQERREFWKRLTLPIRWPIFRLMERIWPRKACSVLTDDEIPF